MLNNKSLNKLNQMLDRKVSEFSNEELKLWLQNNWMKHKDELMVYVDEHAPLNDVVFEKLFRDKVLDFLYKDEVKVFKSATEGTFLVILMDISITPNTTLGRRLWTFSATAYQVDDFTIENCSKYGFSTGGE